MFPQNVIDWDKFTIQGTSTTLFKPYLRLTTVRTTTAALTYGPDIFFYQAPDPAQIRPVAVLKATLKALSHRWREDPDYAWTCDQFKSLRQDLTVGSLLRECDGY